MPDPRHVLILGLSLVCATSALATEEKPAIDKDQMMKAIDLPAAAQELRDAEIDNADVQTILAAARAKALHPGEARDIFRTSADAVGRKGRIDDYGAFVRSKIESGVTGPDLAQLILAEHEKRGKGAAGAKPAPGARSTTPANEKRAPLFRPGSPSRGLKGLKPIGSGTSSDASQSSGNTKSSSSSSSTKSSSSSSSGTKSSSSSSSTKSSSSSSSTKSSGSIGGGGGRPSRR